MRKNTLAALAVLVVARVVEAQSAEPDPSDVAGWVRDFHAATASLEMEFDQFAWSRDYDTTRSSAGRVRLARPGRARIDYTNGNVAIVDGADVLWIEAGDDTWPATYRRVRTDAATHGFGLLSGATDIDATYTTSSCTTEGPPGTVCLELRPRVEIPGLARLRLWVAPDGDARGRVLQLSSEDGGGNWNTFRFVPSSIRVDPTLDPGLFDMTPPAGAREAAGSET